MYQLKFSVSEKYSDWFDAIEEVMSLKIKDHCGILATKRDEKRTYISVACENDHKSDVNQVLKDCFVDMYSCVSKMEYLKENLNLPLLPKSSYNLLLHTLVAFDRECERELIARELNIGDGMALDGIFNFRLRELKSRWDDICALTRDNSVFLTDDATFNELLRFLISAINPKIMKLELAEREGNYHLCGRATGGDFEITVTSADQLMYYLIDLAPLELNLVGEFRDVKLYNRLISIFDAKPESKTVTYGYHK